MMIKSNQLVTAWKMHLGLIIFLFLFLLPVQSKAINEYTAEFDNAVNQYFSRVYEDEMIYDSGSDMSYQFWWYPTAYTGGTEIIFDQWSLGAQSVIFYHNNTAVVGIVGSNQGCRYDSVPAVFPVNTWHHVTITLNSYTKECIFYFDSIASTTDFESGNFGNSATTIGGRAANDTLDGYIDDVRIWAKLLTPAEIASNYNCNIDSSTTSLVAHYKMENNGDDSTVNEFDLTNNNGVGYQSVTFPYVADCFEGDEEYTGTSTDSDYSGIDIITGTGTTTDGQYRRTTIHIPALIILFLMILLIPVWTRLNIEFLIRWRR